MASGHVKAPILSQLLTYIQKETWRNISPNFTGFALKEFEGVVEKLDEDKARFPGIQRLVKDCELGRFTSAKDNIEQAENELHEIQKGLTDLDFEKKNRQMTARGPPPNAYGSHWNDSRDRSTPQKGRSEGYKPLKSPQNNAPQNRERETYTPQKRETYTPQKRETYTPQKRETYTPQKRETYTPQKRETYTPQKRETYSPQKRETYSPMKQDSYNNRNETYSPDKRAITDYTSPRHQGDAHAPGKDRRMPMNDDHGYQRTGHHVVAERGAPHSPAREIQHSSPHNFIDPHKANFDSLRLNSPDKAYDPNRYPPNEDTAPRPMKQGIVNAKDQGSSASALWGREHGDASSEKVANSTYRQAYPGHNVHTSPEREDKNRYKENFFSLNERNNWARMPDDGHAEFKSRPGSEPYRDQVNPDPRPPVELIMQFKSIKEKEWRDAYDETCSSFGGQEKTTRHLLWIVTETYLIACDIADHQLRLLEKQAFGLMVTPGQDNEAWLISGDIAKRQLADLQNNSERIMEIPGPLSSATRDHVPGYKGTNLGDALPKSKTLLLEYRKQTAPLSVRYVVETCRSKISKTLMESLNFPKSNLNLASRLVAYIDKCAEVTWFMSVQDPPIILEYITKESEGARFNREHYSDNNRKGTLYDYGEWPLVRHGRNGPIMARGVAVPI